MMDRKRSSNRLSSFFSTNASQPTDSGASAASSNSSGRLSRVKNRMSSVNLLPSQDQPPSLPLKPDQPEPASSHPLDHAAVPLQPPPSLTSLRPRSTSPGGRLMKSRPTTPLAEQGSGLQAPGDGMLKKNRRKSRLFSGGGSSDKLGEGGSNQPRAWIAGQQGGLIPYGLAPLLNGEKVSELWNDQGDTFVYLFPRTSHKGPSFRIDSAVYASSQYMTRLIHGRLYSESNVAAELPDRSIRQSSGTVPPSRTGSPDVSANSSDGSKGSRALSDATEDDHSEKHLYMPIALSTDLAPHMPHQQEAQHSASDIDTLVTYRNFFAFLIGQSLIATPRHSHVFDIFLRVSDILGHYNFSNVDGSTFGEMAASSFDSYVDELGLADVRHSREKSIEAIVLGERMRSMSLYTEGFVHAVGNYDSIKELQHPKFELISHKTATRMARSALDLETRERNINLKLKEFEFPALFVGLMASDMSSEKKRVRFGRWKSAFMSMRSFAIDYYKTKYGGWLPRARSKKNNLTTSGLNRLVLLDIFHDLSDLYDLLVDRTNLTNRTADGFMSEDDRTDFGSVAIRALRKVLSEYDRSTPPVQPPIPFDVPRFPTLKGIRKDYPTGDIAKDAKARGKKLHKDEVSRMLTDSLNHDSLKRTPFLDAFRHFEHKQAASSSTTAEDLFELRAGQWLFLYSVIQSLPMLVVDSPGVRFTQGVEYFLCEVPRSGVPWGREDTTRTRTWFGVAGGSHVVHLPTDVVEHGVEGVFHRSHCWLKAEEWAKNDAMLAAAMHELDVNAAPLPPPPNMTAHGMLLDPASAAAGPAGSPAPSPALGGGPFGVHSRPGSRSASPDRRRESVMNLGLEALPLPPGVAPPSAASSPLLRPSSAAGMVHDPNKTFDAILGSMDGKGSKGKAWRKKK